MRASELCRPAAHFHCGVQRPVSAGAAAEAKDPAPRDLGRLPARSLRAAGRTHWRLTWQGNRSITPGLETLALEDCLRLFASVPVGRVGFHADDDVVILPVDHAVDGQEIVFRTARGSKLSAAEGQNLVAFEADHYDPRTQSGWSVLATGHAEMVYENAEIQRLGRLGLRSWAAATDHPFWIRIRPTSVTGRQIPATGYSPG